MPGQGRPPETRSKRDRDAPRYAADTKRHFMRCLVRRASRDKPVTAAPVARLLGLPGISRETHRRRCRELVQEMRNEGAPIASRPDGYYLATEVRDFDETERFLRRMGLGQLTTAMGIRRSQARATAAGQLLLDPIHSAVPGRNAHDVYRLDEPKPKPPPHRQEPLF